MKIAVTSLGVKGPPETFTRILREGGYDADFYPYKRGQGYSNIPLDSINIFWHIGAFFNFDILFDRIKEQNPKIRIVLQWVGTDILNVSNFLRARPKCRKCLLEKIDVHVVDCIDFAKELKEKLGIERSYFVPLIPESMPLTPLPEQFAVAFYCPPHRAKFYGLPIILEVARRHPDVPFYVFPSPTVGWGKSVPPLPNVHLVPFVQGDEKFEWWSKCSSFVSIPVHGGVSLMLIEFMQMGRRCIANKKLPYVHYVEEPPIPDKVNEALKEIMKFKEPDEEASNYYHEEYSPHKVLEHVEPVLRKL